MLSLEFFVCSMNDHLDVWVNLSIDDIMATQNFETPVATHGQWRMQDGNKGRLNNKDLGLELEINGNLRLSNRGLMKKSGSLGVVAPSPAWIRPSQQQSSNLLLPSSSLTKKSNELNFNPVYTRKKLILLLLASIFYFSWTQNSKLCSGLKNARWHLDEKKKT